MSESVEDLDSVSENASENEVANKLVNDAIEAAVLQVTDDTSTSSEDEEYSPDPDILCSETVSAPVIERSDDDNKAAEGNIAPGECITQNSVVYNCMHSRHDPLQTTWQHVVIFSFYFAPFSPLQPSTAPGATGPGGQKI